jgi:quercetin dioxygenase-like cupin family protein
MLERGVVFHEVWATTGNPTPITAVESRDPSDRAFSIAPVDAGSLIRVIDFLPSTGARAHPAHMHRTKSIDYGIVLAGEIYMLLDDSETRLTQGDVVVQRGTNHAWVNRSQEVARVAFILLAAEFQPELRALLPDMQLLA